MGALADIFCTMATVDSRLAQFDEIFSSGYGRALLHSPLQQCVQEQFNVLETKGSWSLCCRSVLCARSVHGRIVPGSVFRDLACRHSVEVGRSWAIGTTSGTSTHLRVRCRCRLRFACGDIHLLDEVMVLVYNGNSCKAQPNPCWVP